VKRVTALTPDLDTAQGVLETWVELGLAVEDVSVLASARGKTAPAELQHTTLVPQGAAIGTAVGAAAGLALAAVGVLPGLFALGPALAALQGLAGGAAVGSLGGAVVGLGWWGTEVEVPPEVANADGALVSAPFSPERTEQAASAARAAGAVRTFIH
jgi:hypothetical protein